MESHPNPNKKGRAGGKKKQQLFSGDIVFTSKNGSIQTIPCLNKRLKSVTDAVIGLQYIWEYRSPSKSVPPHYQCKLCKVQRLQNEMAAHITGWKHGFRYMKQNHKDKVPHEEEAALKDPAIRKAVKAAAAEVEKAEGRGQIKTVLKEPFEVMVFQAMKSAQPNPAFAGATGLLGPPPRGLKPGGPYGGPRYMGNFPPRGGMMPDFPPGMHGGMDEPPMRRGYSDMGDFTSPGRYGNGMAGPDRGMMETDDMQHFPDEGPMRMGPDGFGPGQRNEGRGRPFPNDMPMNSSGDRLMGHGPKGPENNSLPATLLKYLDSFRIENEDDAQIVLKVTQKLTDVLMEYRLRSISSVHQDSTTEHWSDG
uniref:Si:ch211-197h24.6 n=1 Tax=Cyprinus carpio carpio TaxID=630221 RepID=A0A9J7Z1D7_CYPCA